MQILMVDEMVGDCASSLRTVLFFFLYGVVAL